jgi:hypothetical protein
MKNIKQRLLIIALLFASTITFAQVGIGTETPLESSALDITSSDKGFLLPRMSSSDRTSINTSADAFGLQVYDIDTKSIWIFDGFQWNELSSKFVDGTNSDDAVFTEGNVGIGTADPEAVLDVVSTDSGFIMPRVANTAAVTAPVNGMMVYDMSSTCAKIYENGAWTDCLSSGGSTSTGVVANCDQNGFEGAYVGSVDLTADNIFTVTITNNTFSTTDISLDITDLVLSGTALGSGSAVTVSSVSPSSVSLSAGESELVTYNLTGTPVTGDLEAEWTKINLSCVKTKTVGIGDATYTNPTNNQYVFSVNDTTLPLDSQGILAIGTTINVPYTGGVGAYAEYISPDVAIDAQYAEDGASNWTFGYSYEAGTYSASGDLVVTLIIKKDGILATFDALRVADITTINFDFVNLPLVVNGSEKPNTIGLDEGGDAIRGSLSTTGAAYDAANVDDLVEITEAEYNQMLTTVPGAALGGNVSDFSALGNLGTNSFYVNVTGNSATTDPIAANSYVAGVKIAPDYGGSNSGTVSIGVSTSAVSGGIHVCITGESRSLTYFQYQIRWFAVKRPSTNTGSNASIGPILSTGLGMTYQPSSTGYSGGYGGGQNCNANRNNTWQSGWTPAIQYTVSTQKSW